ncbi:hypothetical protein HPB50_003464 [Hyalomma asiaticum]|uniref:Uncharacterized protein n=1 Tax=Hyalomma asiaticum TaxID=266040 RepID=A0ACB7S3R3_HYAAI|nr:hypothetical protein HPB50_003464 [Hyalomma asiaticum]
MAEPEVPGGVGDSGVVLQQHNTYEPVQVIPSRRGGFKGMYGGFTFNMETQKGNRCHWHCEVRGCKSRLTTDIYGSDHQVFKLTPHDDDIHRLAELVASERKRKRSAATYKKQPPKKIGDYSYVLEKQEGERFCWRCMYVKCSGRLHQDADNSGGAQSDQLHEGVFGRYWRQQQLQDDQEDSHEKEPKKNKLNNFDSPIGATRIDNFDYVLENRIGGLQFWRCRYQDCPARCRTHDGYLVVAPSMHTCGMYADEDLANVTSSVQEAAGTQGDHVSNEETTQTIQESCRRQQHDEERGEPKEKPNLSDEDKQVQLQDNEISGPVVVKQEPASLSEPLVKTEPSSPPEHEASGAIAAATAAGPQPPRKAMLSDFVHILSDSEDDDGTEDDRSTVSGCAGDIEGQDDANKASLGKRLATADYEDSDDCDEEHGIADRALSGGANLKCSQHARCAQVLQMTDEVGESSERKLRTSMLRQMCQLLKAETQLAKQRCRISVLREQLLAHQLANLKPQSASTLAGT